MDGSHAEEHTIACHVTIPHCQIAYMDDTFGVLKQNETKTAHLEYLECLNLVHPHVQFICELEEDGKLAFLDCLICRNSDGMVSTSVYRKPSNTGLTIHPMSCQNPAGWVEVFKEALCRAYLLSSTPALVQQEIQFLIDNYIDNGFSRQRLQEITDSYRPPELRDQQQLQQ